MSDRVSRRKLLLTVLSLSVIVAAILAALTLTGRITIVLLGVLAFLQGILNGVEVPIRHAFFVQLIEDKSDLPNAIALNSININSTRLIGPAIGGLLIAALGEAACFAPERDFISRGTDAIAADHSRRGRAQEKHQRNIRRPG